MNGSSTAFLRVGALAAGLALLAGCNGDEGVSVDPCQVHKLTVIPQDTTVALGSAFSLLVQPVSDCSVPVVFSPTSDVVEFDASISLVTTKKVGRGEVVVRAGNVTDTAVVNVVAR
ncbi:MAG TPA: hypothetical protein VEQ60_11950 [Longimicrobium sp.]|nr:hypothetical protein [Longimicrobium sp.]